MSTGDSFRQLLHHLHRTALLNERLADRELTATIGVGRTQFLILRTVGESPQLAVSQQRLAEHLGLTKAAVSRHVLAAEQHGWLTTSTERSRREHATALTVAGRNLVARGRAVHAAAERRAVRALGAKRLDTCAATLAEISAMLEQRLQSPFTVP
jgi:DNA-binding MarR family transcriptional regulator